MSETDVSDVSRLNPEFSVRIVVCDHYLTKPIPGIDVIYSDFRGSDIKQVPVLRIFGPTPEGRKACLHVHGVFPYFYIPCPSSNPEPQYLYQIAASLDKALNIALKQATSASQHVYKISLVKGLPFYGYHDKEHLYLKVFLYSPGLIKQAVELCCNGVILGQPFQPHESHLNFTLQFFIDFNLFGMSNIDLQTVRFRKLFQCSDDPLESTDEGLKPESSCFYEADCVASHIINRQRIGKGDGIENPGLEEVWNQEMERRKQLNMSVASKSLSQGRITAEQTESHYKFQQMFVTKMSNLVNQPVDTEVTKKVTEAVYYPALSLQGSQLFNAVDVSVHLPDTHVLNGTRRVLDETLVDMDSTIVDESLALNCSLHYSQVVLNSEDFDLVDILQDMDEKPVEDDSIMGTPANEDNDEINEDDDDYSQAYSNETICLNPDEINEDHGDYSQAYSNETICLHPDKSKDDTESDGSPIWNDSFWDGANIPQLDGTFDDDHVKKVRKRKVRPFKLGLSRPKIKKKDATKTEESANKMDTSEIDEINVSRETIEDISVSHLRRSVKLESQSILEHSIAIEDLNVKDDVQSVTLTELVEKVTKNNETAQLRAAEMYDKQNNFIPEAGPSTNYSKNLDIYEKLNTSVDSTPTTPSHNSNIIDDTFMNSESSPEDNTGIISFYTSKVFDLSLESDKNTKETKLISSHEIELKIENYEAKEAMINTEINHDNGYKNHDIQNHVEVNNENYDAMKDKETNTGYKRNQCEVIDHSVKIITPKIKPPTRNYIEATLEQYNIPKIIYPEPFYSDYKDVGSKVEVGHIVLKLQSKLSRDQKPFEKVTDTSLEEWRHLLFMQTNEMHQESAKPECLRALLAGNKSCILKPVKNPPTSKEVSRWIEERKCTVVENKLDDISKNLDELDNSQVLGLNEDVIDNSISLESNDKEKSLDTTLQVTMQPDGSFLCFGSNNVQNETCSVEAPTVDVNFLTVMLLEVHTSVRGDYTPDPALDAIQAVFLTVTNDSPPNHFLLKNITEILVVDNMSPPKYLDRCIFKKVTYVSNENELIQKVVDLVQKHDPDIMCGYEIEMISWGYLMERAQILNFEIVKEISRITEKYRQKRWRSDEKDFEGKIIGRVMFNVWRLFRHELALSSYSFENCMFEVLKERVPKYSYSQLAEWWGDESRILRWIPCEYYMTRLSGTVRMLEKLDIINRTSELARLFGLQWWEVLSRGSQFRVESLMLRAARPLNLIAMSPTVKQRAAMRAPECLPLIFEPESRYYTDPMIILDFQSLYPSMMIAYNYCFSTCIGRVQNINGDAAYEFGAWRLRIPKSKLETLVANGLVHWSPVGVGFVNPSVRRGVLPALLRRILAARQAVKKSMKLQTDDAVKKAMHSRQLGLKLIANVTYGYTAANFSGRMPCVEVGDSVVAKGRETLERAIKLVRNNPKWKVKVVYGDTDSMFVLAPGATRVEAFEIGQQIADAVTADNPSPVALKLEKVYQPCILQTKKRYVGFMYESPDQEKPVYEAKGIETVRRDGCPAGVKLLQRALCELFSTGDMSLVKRSVCSVLSQLARGCLPPRELFFTREYHGPSGYRAQAAAPPNEIAMRLISVDKRACPRTGERVSWLVTAGPPGAALVRLARTPREFARDPALTPHVAYYATRVLLPPLHRCLSLKGVSVLEWWNELGYTRTSQLRETRLGGIARYMARERCTTCNARCVRGAALCAACADDAPRAAAVLAARGAVARTHVNHCDDICSSCTGHNYSSACENTECPVFWRRITARQKLAHIHNVVSHLPHQFTKEMFEF